MKKSKHSVEGKVITNMATDDRSVARRLLDEQKLREKKEKRVPVRVDSKTIILVRGKNPDQKAKKFMEDAEYYRKTSGHE